MDHVERFNDAHGHSAGDALRACDTLARWGGEEFAMLLPDCPEDDLARAIVERVRAAVPGTQSCSAGLAAWDGCESSEDLTRRADRALYGAKAAGRDRSLSAGELEAAGTDAVRSV